MENGASRRGMIWLTLLFSLVLQIMPMPDAVDAFRPDWVLITVLYWCMALPHRFNIGSAWLAGLMLDVLLGGTLGIYAGAMALVAYLTVQNFQKIRNFSTWQQSLIVAGFSFLFHLVIYWLEHLINDVVLTPSYFLPVPVTLFLWTWAFYLLRSVRRRWRVR